MSKRRRRAADPRYVRQATKRQPRDPADGTAQSARATTHVHKGKQVDDMRAYTPDSLAAAYDPEYPGNLDGKTQAGERTLQPHQAPQDRTASAARQRELIHNEMRRMEAENPIPDHVLEMSLRPADVVHVRKQLLDWWSEPGVWQQRYALQGRRPIEGFENTPLDAEAARGWVEDGFRDAELFWVSTEMTQLVTAMAPSIPDCIPEPPCKDGFVVFSRSLAGLDAETGTEIYTTAYLWRTVTTKVGVCWGIETYCWRDLIHTWRMMDETERNTFRTAMPMRLHPTGGSEWPVDCMTTDFSKLPAGNPRMEQSMLEDRRILATFWALCSQRIALQETYKPDRNIRRQAQREGWRSIPDVRIIRLREAAPRTKGEQRDVEWSHRWIVGSHWRNQWYPSDNTHRPKLIDAYQKGPADKPLVVRETVKALVR